MVVKFHKCRPKIKFPIVAWIIMLFQKMNPFSPSSWSHMAISFIVDQDGDFLLRFIDSTGKGVRNRSDENFLKDYTLVETATFPGEVCPLVFYKWAESIEEKKYDHKGILGQLLNIIFKKNFGIGKNLKRISCQEIPLSFFKEVYGVDIGDSDNYDLLKSWDFIKQRTV